MTEHLITTLTGLRVLGALLALVLVYQATRAWRRSNDGRMFRLTVGFTLLLVSLLVEGAVFQVTGTLELAHIVEAGTQVAAMGAFVWALY